MPRSHARVNVTIHQDAEWRALPAIAQHLYYTLWTHPELSYAGVVDWRPGRLSALAADWSPLDVLEAADCLEARLFIVTDPDTEECLIRSWAKWDGLLKENRMSVSWANAYAATASNEIRRVIVHEARKWRAAFPEWVAWSKPQVLDVLSQPSLDPASRNLPGDALSARLGVPQGVGLGASQGVGLGVGQGSVTPNGIPRVKGSVKGSPTPAPTPTPSLHLPNSPDVTTSPGDDDGWGDD